MQMNLTSDLRMANHDSKDVSFAGPSESQYTSEVVSPLFKETEFGKTI